MDMTFDAATKIIRDTIRTAMGETNADMAHIDVDNSFDDTAFRRRCYVMIIGFVGINGPIYGAQISADAFTEQTLIWRAEEIIKAHGHHYQAKVAS